MNKDDKTQSMGKNGESISSKKSVSVTKEFNGTPITLTTGKLANLTDASVFAQMGETSVLVTVVSKPAIESTDFFPLSIDYEERFYAGGIIGGNRYSRREGKPNDSAIISGRLIDHAVRPLFPKDFMDETQVVITVMSFDKVNDPALLGFLATSAAFSVSGLPFSGPIVPLRIQKKSGELIYGFGLEDEHADLDLVVSYLENGSKVQAIEAHSNILPEEEVLNSIKNGVENVKPLFELLNEFALELNVAQRDYVKSWLNEDSISKFKEEILSELVLWRSEGLYYTDKAWGVKENELAQSLVEKYKEEYSHSQFKIIIGEVHKELVRDLVLNKKERLDGRSFDEIRNLEAQVGLLPRVHGSALFNRGLTQGLSVVTLSGPADKLTTQTMTEETEKRYIHHYNFPPFSTGEVGRVGGANRRAIGHGMLAEKAIIPVLPGEEEFPYTMRVVTEILSSNGSTSMAATCGSSLSLMDAGVPLKAQVAGIGVGLFVDKKSEKLSVSDYVLLTDIVGFEDFAGYMDFKMTGTRAGITAIQMELKLQGVPIELLDSIFETSKNARMKVLDVMDTAISTPRSQISQYAPKLETFTIDKSFIGAVIGSGGSVIKEIMEKYEVMINIEEKGDKGVISITGLDYEKIANAKNYIVSLSTEVEIGQVYEGIVTRVEGYGAFVEILPNKLGLLHVSEYSYNFVDDISQYLHIGDKVTVKVIGLDDGKISVSKKALEQAPEGYVERPRQERSNDRSGNRGGGYNRNGNSRGNYNNRSNNRYDNKRRPEYR